MTTINNVKRVATFYRVSTKQQLDNNENENPYNESDMPRQQRACKEYIQSKPGWELVEEYFERGISGSKVPAAKRDVLQTALDDAKKDKFDVLLVYTLDRLGRIFNETPAIVKAFVESKIEVWSVVDGHRKMESHEDELMNSIYFWLAGVESSKISTNVTSKLIQMVKDGEYRGGTAPYGYKTERTGVYTKEGRGLKRMIIDEDESKIVRRIYSLVADEGYGQHRIAKLLNEEGIKAKTGTTWSASVVGYILGNPIYKGLYVYAKGTENEVTSRELVEKWIILSEQQWDKVQEIRESRRPENVKRETNQTIIKSTTGPLLFVGMIRCSHCGSPLTTSYNYKRYEDKLGHKTSKQVPIYRCSGKALQKKKCTGQTTYAFKKIEGIVLEEVYRYLDQLKTIDLTQELQALKQQNTGDDERKLSQLQMQLGKAVSTLTTLEDKVIEVLNGEGSITEATLSKLIQKKEQEINDLEEKIEETKGVLDSKRLEQEEVESLQLHIPIWKEVFEQSSNGKKKMMLHTIIESVVVGKDNVEVKFKLDFYSFGLSLGSASSQYARVSRWQCEGHRFEPGMLHKEKWKKNP